MAIAKLPANAIVISGPDLDLLRYLVAATQKARRNDGLPPSSRLDNLASAVQAVGQSDTAHVSPRHAETITARQAAEMLQCSTRTVTRNARCLGGRKVGGVWILDRLAVLEHMEGRR